MSQRMSPRRRLLWIGGLVAGITFMLGFLWSWQEPKLRSWALLKIHEVSENDLPVRVLPKDLELHFAPLGATLRRVRILPKEETAHVFEPLTIEEVSVELSLFQLLQGRLRVRDLAVRGTEAKIRVPKTKKSETPPLKGLFDTLARLPLERLVIDRVDLKLDVSEPRMKADVRRVSVTVDNTRRGLAIDAEIGSTHLKDGTSTAAVRVNAEVRALLTRDSITINAFKVRRGDSYLVASGVLKGQTELLTFSDIVFDSRASLHLESMRDWAVRSFPKAEGVPPLKGRADMEASIRGSSGGGAPVADFKLRTDGLYEDRFFIDKIEAEGSYRRGVVRFQTLKMRNPGLSASASNVEVKIPKLADGGDPDGAVTLRADVRVHALKLFDFLKSLGLPGEVPVHLNASAEIPCQGTLIPQFKLNCKGTVAGRDFFVNSKPVIPKSIAAIPRFDAIGKMTVDDREVTYATELSMPRSKGRSAGVINYHTGFRIKYEGDNVDFGDVANLADLRLEGNAKIKGTTEGDSHSAWLKLQIDGTELWFENYWLGNPRAEVSYKDGLLSFDKLSGHMTTSRYSGEVDVDLRKRTIRVDARAPFVDSRDLLKAFSRRVQLPFELTGTGKIDARVWGPLEFNRLSYDLHSTLFRGTVWREPFDEAHFDVRSRDGEVRTERVLLSKGSQKISLTGEGHPDGNINAVVRGRALKLEDSVNVSALGLNLSGLLDFEMNLSEHVLRPLTELRGSITRSAIGDQGVADSSFRLRFTSNTIDGGGLFMGDVLSADFRIPLSPDAPFLLKLKSRDWNYATVFAAVAGTGARRDFDGKLGAEINLSAPSGGFWNSSGSISVNEFLLRRGSLQMSAPEPLKLTMNNGRLGIENFFLEGEGTFLRATESARPNSKVDMQVNGKVDLSLMSLVLPFFEELRGLLSFAFNFRAGPSNASLLGSLYLDKGYLKLFGFPHPFEDIKGDVLFSQEKILLNTLKAELAGGRVVADGRVELKGPKNFPIQISASAENVQLNIPENMKTTGSGRFYFTGAWFPFQMKGVYDVRSGKISREFTAAAQGGPGGVQRSAFLPRMLLAENFAPIEMDLQVNIPSPIDVRNTMVDGRASGKLQIKGTPDRLGVLGTVTAERGTRVLFRDNEFELTAGNITFNNLAELNPQLYVAARSRVTNYDVNLVVQGTAKKPAITLTSSPPLLEQDIISLLALGETTQRLDTAGNQAENLGINLGGSLIQNNPVSNTIKERTNIEVGISTGFDQVNNVAVPRITATRRVNEKLGVTASRSFGQQPQTDLRARFRLSNRFSIVGSWEGQERREGADVIDQTQQQTDRFGLDFEYRLDFK